MEKKELLNLDLGLELDIAKCQEDFISYIDASNNTLETYKNGIENFILFMQKNSIKNPTRTDVVNYRNELRKDYSENTVNSYMTALRRLFGYLQLHGIYGDITKDVKGARHSNTPKKQVLTLDQSRMIYKDLTDEREKALFSLLITTGLRGVEVANASIEDIKVHNDENVLWVQCKGHNAKDEYVKLSPQTMEDIKNYIGNRTTGAVFISKRNGKRVTTKTLRLEIKNIFKRYGLDSDTFSLHSCRRSCATIAYENGADLRSIQQVLHHNSINTTIRYIRAASRKNNKTEYNVANVIFN